MYAVKNAANPEEFKRIKARTWARLGLGRSRVCSRSRPVAHGLTIGTPFFVRYGRVRSMEPISEALGATVTCVLLGERPGLASAESLSAYLAYEATVGMSESARTCVSNIHQEGTAPVEAGAHIADIINEMIKQRTSGVALKLF